MGEPQVGDEFSIKLAFGEVHGVPVSMGNPHYVVFVNEFSPGWQAEAAEIGRHHDFKYGINVELVMVKDQANIDVRFFERGVGETQSSGTGSCAASVASIFTKRAASPVRVHTPGGVAVGTLGRPGVSARSRATCLPGGLFRLGLQPMPSASPTPHQAPRAAQRRHCGHCGARQQHPARVAAGGMRSDPRPWVQAVLFRFHFRTGFVFRGLDRAPGS